MNELNVRKAFILLFGLISVYIALTFSLSNSIGDVSNDSLLLRFWNAILTSYMIGSFILLLTLLMYAESRNVPYAPSIGMLASSGIGALLMLWLLPTLDITLLEGNGTPFAQLLSNVLRFSTSMIAGALSLAIVVGIFYSYMAPSNLNLKSSQFPQEEE